MPWETIFPNSTAGRPASPSGLPAGAGPGELGLGPNIADVCSEFVPEFVMDSEAFSAFYERSARPLWAYLARVSGDRTLADDLMQESFVRLLCASPPDISLVDGEVGARRYLFRIATNLLRDHWRRPATSSIEELPEEVLESRDNGLQTDSQAMLGPALRLISPRERQLLWLAHAEGYSHREIAQITGLASASIRLLLFRARRRIAKILEAQAKRQPSQHECEANDRQQPAAGLRSQP